MKYHIEYLEFTSGVMISGITDLKSAPYVPPTGQLIGFTGDPKDYEVRRIRSVYSHGSPAQRIEKYTTITVWLQEVKKQGGDHLPY